MDNDVALLHQKIDALTEQVAYLTEQAQIQQRRSQDLDELKQDMLPIVNHMVRLTIDELAEIDPDFDIDDLFFLLKRVLRNIPLILAMFDRLEAIMGIGDEVELLGKQVFSTAVEHLDRLEREGYFAFARQGWGVLEEVVAEFPEENFQAMSENLVPVLTALSSPEMMTIASNAVTAMQEAPAKEDTPSTFALLRELSSPQVRRGMARMLRVLKAMDTQSPPA